VEQRVTSGAAVQEQDHLARTVIEPTRGWVAVNWRKIWQSRELLFFLTWRDIKVRYKQTVLGVLWAFMQPFLKLVVFTFVFGFLLRVGGSPEKYILVTCPAMLPWQFFMESLGRSSQSAVASPDLIRKVYFPRLIIPFAAVGACLLDFAISFPILIALMLYFGVAPTISTMMVVPLVLLTILVAVGMGSFLCALNVAYRDFRYVIPFMLQIWMFLSPVVYPASMVMSRLPWLPSWLPALNPMWGILEGYRAAVLPDYAFQWASLGVSVCVALAMFVAGALYFRRIERYFADMI
jgi:lipopolysaccharide transport system permease protein